MAIVIGCDLHSCFRQVAALDPGNRGGIAGNAVGTRRGGGAELLPADVNLLLCAYSAPSSRQRAAGDWLESVLNGSEAVAAPWAVLQAFVRIATNRAAFEAPMTTAAATAEIAAWFQTGTLLALIPGPGIGESFRGLP